jgi:hypothetical protein
MPAEDLVLYPNPATTEINIQNKVQGITNITVYDVVGKKILSKKILSKELLVKIDVSSFSPGMYIVKANGNGYLSTAKFVRE